MNQVAAAPRSDWSAAIRWAPYVVLALSLSSAAWFSLNAAGTRGLWFDELCTLYLTDPSGPISAVAADVHPPVYYFLVRTAQSLGLAPQPALWAVNITVMALFSAIALAFLHRAGHLLFGVVAFGTILAGPAVLTYALEGRNYVIAQFATLALSAAVLVRVDDRPRPLDLPIFAGLSLACASIHTYAALFAGSIGTALILIALMERKASNVILGLTIAATATVVTLAWAVVVLPLISTPHPILNWIPNSIPYTVGQYWFFNKMLSGTGINVALLLVGTAFSAFSRDGRKYALLLAIVTVLFLTLPLIVSIVRPMLVGRYLAVAAPALVLIALYTGWRAALADVSPGSAFGTIGASMLGLFAVVGDISAHGVAARATSEFRHPYHVAELLAALGEDKNPRLRVFVPDWPMLGAIDVHKMYKFSYDHALNRPGSILETSLGPPRDVADYPGPVVAWGEHVTSFDLSKADVVEVLAWLRLTNVGDRPLRLEKHGLGFLLLAEK